MLHALPTEKGPNALEQLLRLHAIQRIFQHAVHLLPLGGLQELREVGPCPALSAISSCRTDRQRRRAVLGWWWCGRACFPRNYVIRLAHGVYSPAGSSYRHCWPPKLNTTVQLLPRSAQPTCKHRHAICWLLPPSCNAVSHLHTPSLWTAPAWVVVVAHVGSWAALQLLRRLSPACFQQSHLHVCPPRPLQPLSVGLCRSPPSECLLHIWPRCTHGPREGFVRPLALERHSSRDLDGGRKLFLHVFERGLRCPQGLHIHDRTAAGHLHSLRGCTKAVQVRVVHLPYVVPNVL